MICGASKGIGEEFALSIHEIWHPTVACYEARSRTSKDCSTLWQINWVLKSKLCVADLSSLEGAMYSMQRKLCPIT